MKVAAGKTKPSKVERARPRNTLIQENLNVQKVVDHLFDLFAHLGIDVPRPALSEISPGSIDRDSSSLYPLPTEFGELLTHWHQNPHYIDDDGNPKSIKIKGRRPSLESLARISMPTLNIDYIKGELTRLGVISIVDDLAKVNMRAFPAYEDKSLAIQHTLAALDGFIRTLRHNLDSEPSNSNQLFHRIAQRNDFDIRKIPELKIRAKRQGQAFLESFDNWLVRQEKAKPTKRTTKRKTTKVSIGVYLSVVEP